MTAQQPAKQDARAPALDRDVAQRLATTEYERVATLLAALTPEQWTAPTDCPGWDVRAVAGHLLGMMQMATSLPALMGQQLRSQRRAKAGGTSTIDALTALQVERNASLTTREVVEQVRRTAPRATRFKRRIARVVGSRTMPELQQVGDRHEAWTFGYLFDIILTRDPFMHRIDISRAAETPWQATEDHEKVVVDDIVREWADRHGEPYTLQLSGPVSGRWERDDGPLIDVDVVEFCRALSGRGRTTGLLSVQVPF